MGSDAESSCPSSSVSSEKMVHQQLAIINIRVIRGINLAIRDFNSSDPYVVIRMGKQKKKTHTKKRNLNPVWNEDLTIRIKDPKHPIMLTVYDNDAFSKHDKMGVAEIDIRPFLEAVTMNFEGRIFPCSGTIITKVTPNNQNCLSEESCIYLHDGKVVQDMCLALKKVECGKIELQLQWMGFKENKANHSDSDDEDEEKKKSKFKKFGKILKAIDEELKKMEEREKKHGSGDEEEEEEDSEEEEEK